MFFRLYEALRLFRLFSLCKQYTYHSRIARNNFSRVWLTVIYCITFQAWRPCKTCSLFAACLIRMRCRPHQLPPNASHFPQHLALPDLPRGPPGEPSEAHPLHAEPFGRLAIQRSPTGYDPKKTLEVANTHDKPANATSKRTRFCSTSISVQEVPTTLFSGEVDDPRIGKLASPLLEQKKEASVTGAGVYYSQGERSTSHSQHRDTGKPVARHSHKRKTNSS